MKKVIIFDFDGVIVDSLDVYEKAVISVFQKNGFSQINSRKSFLALFDGNFFEGLIRIGGVSSEKIPALIKELNPKLQSLQGELKLFNGIREVLLELSSKCKIYIATSNFTDVVKSYLRSQRMENFESIVGGDQEKSKVKKIENIAAKHPGKEIFYVGDTKGDMIEGKRAGAKTIAVTWGWHDTKRLKEGNLDYIASKPSEILSIIGK